MTGPLLARTQYWNTTTAEQTAEHPADRHGPRDGMHLVRALDVDAPADVVFRWLCQIRIAPYSYDLVDNLGRRSPQTLTPGADELAVGQRFAVFARIAEFAQDDFIVATSRRGSAFGELAMSYQVVPGVRARSRILACIALPPARGVVARAGRAALSAGDLVMMRRQLTNLRRLAEGTSARDEYVAEP